MFAARPFALLLVLLVAACATPAQLPQAQDKRQPIAIDRFFDSGGQSFTHRLSPDGQKLAWAESDGNTIQIQVRNLADGKTQRHRNGAGALGLVWAPDSRHLLLRDDDDGDENDRIRVLDTADPNAMPRDLIGEPDVRIELERITDCGRNEIVVRSNRRDRSVFDLIAVNIETGQERMLARNTGSIRWWRTDRCGTPLFRGRGRLVERADGPPGEWTPSFVIQPNATFRPVGVATRDGPLFALSDQHRDRLALVSVDPVSGTETVVADDPISDIERSDIAGDGRSVLVASSMPGYPRDVVLDPDLQAALAPIRPGEPHRLVLNDVTRDGRRFLVTISTEKRGAELFLVNAEARDAERIARSRLADLEGRLADTRPITFPTRDGRTLHGYITTPREGAAPFPTVMLVHGGPWARDNWGYDSLVQFLASRGYAVLRINYRGSSGYGRALREAAIGEFGAAMHTDLLDGLTFAITTGDVDPTRVAIAGQSYGGYATLVGLTLSPDTFVAGVSIVGIADLPRFLETTPPYWALGIAGWYQYVGDPRKPVQRRNMLARSPITFADRVTAPLLLVHGQNDVRVRVEQSELMADALRSRKKQVDLMIFPDEGHGIRKRPNRVTLYRTIEQFLDKHVKSRPPGRVASLSPVHLAQD